MRQRSAAVIDEQPPEVKTPEVVATVTVDLSQRAGNPTFFKVRDALRIIDAGGTGTLWQAAAAEPDADLTITITRNK